MSYVHTEIDQSRNLIVQTVTGDFTLQQFIKTFKKTINHPDFKSGMNVLWDFSDASLASTETDDIHQMIQFIRFHIDKRGTNFKLAIVARGKLEFGLSRMYQAYGEILPFDKKVFYDLQQAVNWINSSKE